MNSHKSLRIFLLAAELKNFAQVARDLNMTPAAVTRAIATLEANLGVQLFVRTTRQVSLTTDGAIYAAQIKPALDMLDIASKNMINANKSDEGIIRISAPIWLGQKLLPAIISRFNRLYPKILFQISLSDDLVNILEDDYDLAIRISLEPSDKYTIWRKICTVPRILVAAPNSRFVKMSHPSEMRPEDCLAYSGESRRENWVLSDGDTSISILAGGAFGFNSGEFLADMAAEGLGVALLPGFNIANHIQSGRLYHVFQGWSPPMLWLTLYYPPYHKLPPRIATFSNYFEVNLPVDLHPKFE